MPAELPVVAVVEARARLTVLVVDVVERLFALVRCDGRALDVEDLPTTGSCDSVERFTATALQQSSHSVTTSR